MNGDVDQSAADVVLVPVQVRGQRIYISASTRGPALEDAVGAEQEIAARRPSLEHVFNGLAGFAEQIADRMKETNASRLTVEFGCEVLVESGSFIAVIGKASATSTIKVGLEWVRPTE